MSSDRVDKSFFPVVLFLVSLPAGFGLTFIVLASPLIFMMSTFPFRRPEQQITIS
jgi:hypothetical protein